DLGGQTYGSDYLARPAAVPPAVRGHAVGQGRRLGSDTVAGQHPSAAIRADPDRRPALVPGPLDARNAVRDREGLPADRTAGRRPRLPPRRPPAAPREGGG